MRRPCMGVGWTPRAPATAPPLRTRLFALQTRSRTRWGLLCAAVCAVCAVCLKGEAGIECIVCFAGEESDQVGAAGRVQGRGRQGATHNLGVTGLVGRSGFSSVLNTHVCACLPRPAPPCRSSLSPRAAPRQSCMCRWGPAWAALRALLWAQAMQEAACSHLYVAGKGGQARAHASAACNSNQPLACAAPALLPAGLQHGPAGAAAAGAAAQPARAGAVQDAAPSLRRHASRSHLATRPAASPYAGMHSPTGQ